MTDLPGSAEATEKEEDVYYMKSSIHPLFVEIQSTFSHKTKGPDRVEVFVSRVEPRYCSAVVREVSKRQRQDQIESDALSHLKRVRRFHLNDSTTTVVEGKQTVHKKQKIPGKLVLEVLLGKVSDHTTQETKDWLSKLENTYSPLEIETRSLPGRPASSRQELAQFNLIWPTVYFHERSEEHQRTQLELSPEQIAYMQRGLREAILDAKKLSSVLGVPCPKSHVVGAVIGSPEMDKIVSRASEERQHQALDEDTSILDANPLSSSPILAVQGVSRIERAVAQGYGMDSDVFQQGQYLCTSYDLFVTKEPSVFEAMAMVHSRVGRVIFGVPNAEDGGLGGTGFATAVHSLPGTNHHYRVFAAHPGSTLWQECHDLLLT